MKRDKREFTEEEIKQAVAESKSYAELARKLGYNDKSGHYTYDAKKWIKKYNCDTSHFTGSLWNKGNYDLERFKKKKVFRGSELLKFLTKGMGRPYQCECCGNSEWNGLPIPLQVHHIDGNHFNNEINNLQLLCPNCHAQTDTFCGKNKSKENITDKEIIEAIKTSYSISEVLRKINTRDVPRYRNKIKLLIENNNCSLLVKE